MNISQNSYNPSGISQNNADIEEAKETLEILFDINQILNCGLDRQQLSVLISLCENGINPEALAAVVKELRKEAAALKLTCLKQFKQNSTS